VGELAQSTTSLVTDVESGRTAAERLALSFLLGYSGHSRRAYTNDLRSWFGWCAQIGIDPLDARRSHVDGFARWLAETPQLRTGKPAAPATVVGRRWALPVRRRRGLGQLADLGPRGVGDGGDGLATTGV
jgi:hypothetical protein